MGKLTDASDEELEAENQRLMAERAEAEQSFKKQQEAVRDELNRRAVVNKLADALEGVSEEQRVAILEIVKGA